MTTQATGNVVTIAAPTGNAVTDGVAKGNVEQILEYFDSRGVAMRVDLARGILRGVKLLGLSSRNGRRYLPEALARAAALYEGAKVNVNHPKGHPLAARDYQDRLGVIRNVKANAGEGLFADLHFNPKHALSEQLAWDAAHAPENVGLSHNVEARLARRGGDVVVEDIVRVQSVDLVADPATTRGLFEAISAPSGESANPREPRATEPSSARLQELLEEVARLRAEVDRLRAVESASRRMATVRQLLREFRLPEPDQAEGVASDLVSEQFVATLMAAPSEAAVRTLVSERAALIAGAKRWSQSALDGQRPVSREQQQTESATAARVDAAAFARAIT